MDSRRPPSYDEANTARSKPQHSEDYAPYPSISVDHTPSAPPFSSDWGATVIGSPSNPTSHPHNQQAASDHLSHHTSPSLDPAAAKADHKDQEFAGSEAKDPKSAADPGSNGAGKKPFDNILENLNKWGKKAEDVAGNVWSHLKTGPSVTDTAWGRLNQGAKVLKEGGLEKVFKQSFDTIPDEQLKKSYACYLSTSTGPVVGTLYISTAKFAFCSDRPLQLGASDQQTQIYYKVIIPLEKVKAVNPSANKDKPAEKYIQIETLDDHEFWFMGFVNYDKGLRNLQAAISVPSSA